MVTFWLHADKSCSTTWKLFFPFMTYGGSDFIRMLQKNNKITCNVFLLTFGGGQDNWPWQLVWPPTHPSPDEDNNQGGEREHVPWGSASCLGGKISWDPGLICSYSLYSSAHVLVLNLSVQVVIENVVGTSFRSFYTVSGHTHTHAFKQVHAHAHTQKLTQTLTHAHTHTHTHTHAHTEAWTGLDISTVWDQLLTLESKIPHAKSCMTSNYPHCRLITSWWKYTLS